MDSATIIGLAAACFTSFAGLPQILKILKVRHTRDISLEMFVLMCLGVSLWLAYGIMKKDLPLIAANSVSLLISGTILGMKLHYK